MDTNRLSQVIREKLQSKPDIAEQILLRLNNVAYVTEQNGQSITQHTQQGTPQGCPLRPQTFNIGMEEIGNETNMKRRDKLGLMDLNIPLDYIKTEHTKEMRIIEMHRTYQKPKPRPASAAKAQGEKQNN